jgi:hypothetical protein
MSDLLNGDFLGPVIDRLWPRTFGLSPWRKRIAVALLDPIELQASAEALISFCRAIGPLMGPMGKHRGIE